MKLLIATTLAIAALFSSLLALGEPRLEIPKPKITAVDAIRLAGEFLEKSKLKTEKLTLTGVHYIPEGFDTGEGRVDTQYWAVFFRYEKSAKQLDYERARIQIRVNPDGTAEHVKEDIDDSASNQADESGKASRSDNKTSHANP